MPSKLTVVAPFTLTNSNSHLTFFSACQPPYDAPSDSIVPESVGFTITLNRDTIKTLIEDLHYLSAVHSLLDEARALCDADPSLRPTFNDLLTHNRPLPTLVTQLQSTLTSLRAPRSDTSPANTPPTTTSTATPVQPEQPVPSSPFTTSVSSS